MRMHFCLRQSNLELLSRAAVELPPKVAEPIMSFFELIGELTECIRFVQHAFVHHFFQTVRGCASSGPLLELAVLTCGVLCRCSNRRETLSCGCCFSTNVMFSLMSGVSLTCWGQ